MNRTINFTKKHPSVLFLYLFGILALTMCCRHPVLLGISLVVALMVNIWLRGFGFLKNTLIMTVIMLAFTVGFLPLFTHHGVTPLYYINGMPVTLECMIYGVVMTEMLLAVVLWCGVLSSFIDSEKLLYLTGKMTPAIGLLLSMVLGMLPRLKRQYREIRDGQRGLGKSPEGLALAGRIRLLMKEFSILMSWGLEDSVETSISMESRGYGCGRRSFFHLFTFHQTDLFWILYFVAGYGIVALEMAGGYWKGDFFPEIRFPFGGGIAFLGAGIAGFVSLSPLWYQFLFEIRKKIGVSDRTAGQ